MGRISVLAFVVVSIITSAFAKRIELNLFDGGPKPIIVVDDTNTKLPGTTHTVTITFDKSAGANTSVLLSSNSGYITLPSSVTLTTGQTSLTVNYTISTSAPTQNVTLTATTQDGSAGLLVSVAAP